LRERHSTVEKVTCSLLRQSRGAAKKKKLKSKLKRRKTQKKPRRNLDNGLKRQGGRRDGQGEGVTERKKPTERTVSEPKKKKRFR